jgi:putative intracellular protease/amidase
VDRLTSHCPGAFWGKIAATKTSIINDICGLCALSVQQEVTRALARPEDFLDVPTDAPDHRRKAGGMVRDTWDDSRAAFVVRDGDYVSARWPGDAHTFARRFAEVLAERCSR